MRISEESESQAARVGRPEATGWGIAGLIFALKEVAKVKDVRGGLCSNLLWIIELAGACARYKTGAIPPYRARWGLLPSCNTGNSMGCS